MGGKLVGKPNMSGNRIYIERMESKERKVLADDRHRLCSQFQLVKSGRHLRVSRARGAFKKSFIPNAVRIVH